MSQLRIPQACPADASLFATTPERIIYPLPSGLAAGKSQGERARYRGHRIQLETEPSAGQACGILIDQNLKYR